MSIATRFRIANALMASMISSAAAQSDGYRGCARPVAEAALGLTTIECLQCSVHSSGADRWVEYGAEPVVRGARPGGPIQSGDVLVAIDGRLITTVAGGLRLAHVALFHPTVLTVRRGGQRIDVSVTPIAGCAFSLAVESVVKSVGGGLAALAAARGDSGRQSYTVRLETPGHFRFVPVGNPESDTIQFHFENDTLTGKPLQPFTRNGDTLRYSMHGASVFGPWGQGVMLTDSAGGNFVNGAGDQRAARGWTGFTIFCFACTADSSSKGRMVVHFAKSPQVAGVDRGSAAEAAGLRYGLFIREIDGLDLTTPAGARRFSSLQPGDRVHFTLETGYPVRRIEVVLRMPAMQ
jgi:hypothetical protein